MADSPLRPRVLISFARDDGTTTRAVARLADRLEAEGIDTRWDVKDLDAGMDVFGFMRDEIRDADFVIAYCTPAYKAKVAAMEGGGSSTGPGFEVSGLFDEVFLRGKCNKGIPVVGKGSRATSVPQRLATLYSLDLSAPQSPAGQEAFTKLVFRISGDSYGLAFAEKVAGADAGADREDLRIAQRTESEPEARRLLEAVVARCRERVESRSDPAPHALIGSAAARELALLSAREQERTAWREEAIALIERAGTRLGGTHPQLAEQYANRVVDAFYDPWVRVTHRENARRFALSLRRLRSAEKNCASRHEQARLLLQRASVLRAKAMIEAHDETDRRRREELRARRAQEAVDAAQQVLVLSPHNPFARLELGQGYWSLARRLPTERQYFDALNRAERALAAAAASGGAVCKLVLARFYRQTSRPLHALATFWDYQSEETNLRRLWAESVHAAEPAVQLAANDYAPDLVTDQLTRAYKLVRTAIECGAGTARHFVGLARLEAELGFIDQSHRTIAQIGTPEPGASWSDAVDAVMAGIRDDHSHLGTAWKLGINDSAVWNAIGTYFARNVGDRDAARRCYELAIRIQPRNAVAHTNLARLLVRHEGGPEALLAADDHLDKAARFADRSFRWWREVRLEWRMARGGRRDARPKRRPEGGWTRYREVSAAFRALDFPGLTDAQRERTLMELMADLVEMNVGTGVPSPSGGGRLAFEIDGHEVVFAIAAEASVDIGRWVDDRAQSIVVAPLNADCVVPPRPAGWLGAWIPLSHADLVRVMEGGVPLATVLEVRMACEAPTLLRRSGRG